MSEWKSALVFFFFNDTATTEIYTLSLHDALPISRRWGSWCRRCPSPRPRPPPWPYGPRLRAPPRRAPRPVPRPVPRRSEEHTSELQSRQYLVCRLLLEKKNKKQLYFSRSSIISMH